MKKLFTLLFACFTMQFAFAQSGIFDDAIKIQKNGGAQTEYYFGIKCPNTSGGCVGSNSSTTPNFVTDIGAGVTSLKITWAEVRTFKGGDDDVTGAHLFYRVYKAGDNPGYTDESLSFGANISGGDQRWTETLNIELASTLVASTVYTLEIYSNATCNNCSPSPIFNSNGGSNFKMTFTTDATLAAETTSFVAKKSSNATLLAWQTTTEKDNALFQIERASNATDFSPIGEVKAAGNSNAVKNYTFTDAAPLSGVNYYRLKALDYNGAATLSKVVSVNFNGKNDSKTTVYPNPARDVLQLDITASDASTSTIQVTDLTGRVVMSQNRDINKGANQLPLNVSALPSGAYFVKVNADVLRFIKL